ncbi:MAG TPA: HAMP domain-containing protein, partial [Candidatus Acidoferrum sp.]|nr:HAMP domain-containing protein [Candidatus Acidoferrum sp.]
MLTRSLLGKLLGVHILIILFVILIVWVVIDYLAAAYFMTLMEKYKISPTASHQMFVSAVHRYLLWTSLGSLLLAAGLSLGLMRRVLGPLREMTEITRKISAGDFSGRVPMASRDEVGQLAVAFNRMAEGLQRIEQLRKSMVIDVAHELRTPLTNIKGYLEAIADRVVPPSKETIELLQEEAWRLGRLVEDLLSLAKADAARTDLHREKIRVSPLILHALDAFRPQFHAKGIQVDTDFSEETEFVSADREKLAQVISNLLQNARQYTPRGGSVRIFSSRTTEEVRFIFANPG